MTLPNGDDRPIPNSYWVIPGRLAAGEYPGEVDPMEAAAKIQCLLRGGLNHFIDLTEQGERTNQGELVAYRGIANEEALNIGISIQWNRHPIPDTNVPDSPEAMAGTLDAIDYALAAGSNVYVHCWGGAGRTGAVIGCWLVRHGHTGEEALAKIARWWQGVDKAYRQPRSPNEKVQREYVRHWTEPE